MMCDYNISPQTSGHTYGICAVPRPRPYAKWARSQNKMETEIGDLKSKKEPTPITSHKTNLRTSCHMTTTLTTQMDDQSKLRRQICGLREDVLKVEAEGLAGWFVGPLKFLASPALEVAERVVPQITSVVPFSHQIAGLGFGAVSNVGRLAHEVGTAAGVLVDAGDDKFIVGAIEELKRQLLEWEHVLHHIAGFGLGVGIDIATALLNREKLLKWMETIKELKGFLMLSGVGEELQKELFRSNAISDMILLHKAQQQRQCIGSDLRASETQLADGYHFMKFATAVYGISSINAARSHQKWVPTVHLFGSNSRRGSRKLRGHLAGTRPPTLRRYHTDEPHELATRKAISEHILVDEMEISAFVTPGGDNHILRHFVAVDRARRQIVLSIRGTFSVSELIIDMDGHTREFCGGVAHRGIANQAELLWDKVGDIVLDALNQYPGFELVITGHSLGAGTACLLTILCYKQRLVGNTKVRCFAYAPPPVFYPLSAAKKAVANTICYIHNDDVVPFISVATTRKLVDSMRAVKAYRETHHMKSTMINGEIDPGILDAITKASRSKTLDDIPGAEQVFIPASKVIWMRGSSRDGYEEAFVYKPEKLPETSTVLDLDMVGDHSCWFYEESLRALLMQTRTHNETKASLSYRVRSDCSVKKYEV